ARSAGSLLPSPDPDIDDAIPGDTPGHIDGRAAFIEDRAVADREPVAIGAVARSGIGDDEHAPVAIVGCSRSGGPGRQQGGGENEAASERDRGGAHANHLDGLWSSKMHTGGPESRPLRHHPQSNRQIVTMSSVDSGAFAYVYKSSLMGAPLEFHLAPDALEWRKGGIGGRT